MTAETPGALAVAVAEAAWQDGWSSLEFWIGRQPEAGATDAKIPPLPGLCKNAILKCLERSWFATTLGNVPVSLTAVIQCFRRRGMRQPGVVVAMATLAELKLDMGTGSLIAVWWCFFIKNWHTLQDWNRWKAFKVWPQQKQERASPRGCSFCKSVRIAEHFFSSK